MNKLKIKIENFLNFVIIASIIITLISTFIFITDIKNSKGMTPIIFFFLFLYVINSFFLDMSVRSVKKKIRFDIKKIFFAIVMLAAFILSIFVYWV